METTVAGLLGILVELLQSQALVPYFLTSGTT